MTDHSMRIERCQVNFEAEDDVKERDPVYLIPETGKVGRAKAHLHRGKKHRVIGVVHHRNEDGTVTVVSHGWCRDAVPMTQIGNMLLGPDGGLIPAKELPKQSDVIVVFVGVAADGGDLWVCPQVHGK